MFWNFAIKVRNGESSESEVEEKVLITFAFRAGKFESVADAVEAELPQIPKLAYELSVRWTASYLSASALGL